MLKKIRYILEVLLAYGFFFIIKLLPFKIASNFGALLGLIAKKLSKRRNEYSINAIKLAFPEKSDSEANEILTGAWKNFGRVVVEIAFSNEIAKTLHIPNKDEVLDLMKKQNGLILMGAHIANWEIGLKVIDMLNISAAGLYKKPSNPYINNFFLNLRIKNSKTNQNLKLYAGNAQALIELNRHIKNKECIYMLVDQKINLGVATPFFGRNALTNTTLPMIAIKNNVPITPLKIVRNPNNTSFTVHIDTKNQIFPPNTGNYKDDVYTMCCLMNKRIESWIKEKPEQWFWLHRRW